MTFSQKGTFLHFSLVGDGGEDLRRGRKLKGDDNGQVNMNMICGEVWSTYSVQLIGGNDG